jgi:hypothetical protein
MPTEPRADNEKNTMQVMTDFVREHVDLGMSEKLAYNMFLLERRIEYLQRNNILIERAGASAC